MRSLRGCTEAGEGMRTRFLPAVSIQVVIGIVDTVVQLGGEGCVTGNLSRWYSCRNAVCNGISDCLPNARKIISFSIPDRRFPIKLKKKTTWTHERGRWESGEKLRSSFVACVSAKRCGIYRRRRIASKYPLSDGTVHSYMGSGTLLDRRVPADS